MYYAYQEAGSGDVAPPPPIQMCLKCPPNFPCPRSGSCCPALLLSKGEKEKLQAAKGTKNTEALNSLKISYSNNNNNKILLFIPSDKNSQGRVGKLIQEKQLGQESQLTPDFPSQLLLGVCKLSFDIIIAS